MHTVLLIEDQPEIASMVRFMISRSGHRALLAMNLKEAEQIWSAYKDEITILITDNRLPDGSGVTFAQKLHQDRRTLKIIVSTGLPEPHLPPEFHRLDKPFTMPDLLKVIQAVTGDD